MATVRRLGLFSLPKLSAFGTQCVQPASSFVATTLDGVSYTIAPADLPQSTYTLLSLERAMLWMWRIKSFSLSASLTVNDESGDEPIDVEISNVLVPNLAFNLLSDPIKSEREKICDVGMFYADEQSEDFEELAVGSWRIQASIGALSSMWANYPSTPPLNVGISGQRVRADFEQQSFFVPVYLDLSARGNDVTFSYSSGSTTTSEAGEDKTIAWKVDDALGSISKPFRFGNDNCTGTVLMTATEYWPYNP